jgi:uncharacterized protein YjbJ (UPF0337 family)
MMFKTKSSRRDKAEGWLDRIGGRILELVSRITGGSGRQKAKGKPARRKATGKAARARGSARTRRGQAKQRARS